MTNNDKVTLVSTLSACHSRFGDNSTVFALCLCAIIYTFSIQLNMGEKVAMTVIVNNTVKCHTEKIGTC